MIPVLYEKNESTFTHNGLGTLPDAALCLITEERNGIFELSMNYPVTGLHYGDLQIGRTIKARNAYNGEQLFDIYAISRPMNGLVTINAQHISYRLNQKVLLPCTAGSCTAAMTAIENHILDGSDFDFWTDKTVTANWKCETPKNVRSALGGAEGSVLDVYGPGEYEWDNFDVKFYQHRGADTGVSIRYGKNLVDLVADEDGADVYTACVAYYTAQNGTVVYTSKVKTSEWSATNDLVSTIDMAQFFTPPAGASDSWTPTTSEMETKALQLMTANNVAAVAQNLKVEFELLSQTKEYENLAALERVNLCDTITVTHPGMGVNVKVKVIKTVWNALLDRYDSLELGEPTANFANTITAGLSQSLEDIKAELGDKVDWSHMDIAIANATELITGGAGGYVVLGQNADGEPNEIFIMDAPDQANAVNIIRLNKNGVGFSTQGINGPYTNAWTIDGHLVADFIDTGVLDASIMTAGIITDRTNTNYWNLESGDFHLSGGTNIGNNNTVGKTVVACDVEYGNSSSSSTAPATWTTNASWVQGKYLWTRVKYTLADGTTSYSAARLVANDKGIGNASVVEQYYLSTSNTTQSGGSWSDTQQTWVTGRYYWTRSKITWSDGSVTYTDAVLAKALTSGNQSTDDLDSDLNQTEVFNRLTNNGQTQGIYLENSKLYINASYSATGTLKDTNENFKLLLSDGTMTMKKGSISLGAISGGGYNFTVDSSGNVAIKSGSISLGSSSGTYYFNVATTGAMQWKSSNSSMSSTGVLTATGATITGKLTTTATNNRNVVVDGETTDIKGGTATLSRLGFQGLEVWDSTSTSTKRGSVTANTSLTESDTSLYGLRLYGNPSIEMNANTSSGKVAITGKYLTFNSKDIATQEWVTNQGYLTSVPSGYATQTWVQNQNYLTSSSLSGYATQSWVEGKGYLTSTSLNGYATQTWVQNQGYLTSAPTLSTLSSGALSLAGSGTSAHTTVAPGKLYFKTYSGGTQAMTSFATQGTTEIGGYSWLIANGLVQSVTQVAYSTMQGGSDYDTFIKINTDGTFTLEDVDTGAKIESTTGGSINIYTGSNGKVQFYGPGNRSLYFGKNGLQYTGTDGVSHYVTSSAGNCT